MSDVKRELEEAVASEQLTPEEGRLLADRYDELIRNTGSETTARQQLIFEMEQEADQRRQNYYENLATLEEEQRTRRVELLNHVLEVAERKAAEKSQPVSLVQKILQSVLGLALGFGAGLGLLAALWAIAMAMGATRVRVPIVAPFIFAGFGALVGWSFEFEKARLVIRSFDPAAKFHSLINPTSKHIRFLIVFMGLWLFAVLVVFQVFDPFDRSYWQARHWYQFLTILFGPPLLGILGLWLSGWVSQGK